MVEHLPVPTGQEPSPAMSTLGREWKQDKWVYKTALKIALEIGEEGLKALIPGGGLLVKAAKGMLDLSDAADDAEVGEQIERLLAIGGKTGQEVEEVGILAQLILLRQDEILERIEAKALPVGKPELDEIARQTALVAYRNWIAQDYLYADYRGIEGLTREGQAAALLLDQVYVKPRLRPEREQQETATRETLLLKQLEDQDLTRIERARVQEEYAALTGKRWGSRLGEAQPGLDIGDALGKTRQAVILGGPGVGKSVLLRYLARTCALGTEAAQVRLSWPEAPLPILIPLAAFADVRGANPQLSLRDFLEQRMTKRGGEALRQAVAAVLDAGDAIVLFDGIDEIPDPAARIAVVRGVEQFLGDHSQTRGIVTSRPYGYIRLAGTIEHLTLGNFSDEQVSEFVVRWQRAFECWRRPQASDLKAADAEAKAMIEEIKKHEKVAELARNPLMLVIVALIRYEGGKLPEKRVQLYERAVRTLMETWNRWRSEPGINVGGVELPYEKLVQVWGRIAEWTRREKPTGVVHREELQRRLIETLEELEFDEDDPEATADSYLNAAVEKAGLLEERGHKVFAFWHPTFEEFLAAGELARTPGRLLPLRDDPRWHEVILLTLGFIGVIKHDQDAATALLDRVAHDTPTPLEPLFLSHLRLAAACIADDVGTKRSSGDRLIGELAECLPSLPYGRFHLSFVNTVRALPRLRPSTTTFRSLAALVKHPSWEARMEAVRLIANLAASSEAARDLCTSSLGDHNSDVQLHAAIGLIRAGDRRPEVLAALRYWSSSLAHARVTVADLMRVFPELRPALLGAEDPSVRLAAAWLLLELGEADDQVIGALVSGLGAEEPGLRLQAAGVLLQLGKADDQVIGVLVSSLGAEDPGLRLEAARLLVELGKADDQVIGALVSSLGAEDPGLRLEAARLLVELGKADDQVIGALVSGLGAEDTWLRLQAAGVFLQLGKADNQVIGALVSWLGAEDPGLRREAARLLVELGKADDQVIGALVSWLGAEDPGLRREAARLLVELGKADDQVIGALVSGLGAEDPGLRREAARLLVELGKADDQVIGALVSWLGAEDPGLRLEAARLLVELGKADDQVIGALVSGLGAEDTWLRLQVTRLLVELASERPEVFEALVQRAHPKAWTALSAWGKLRNQEPLTEQDGRALAEVVSVRKDDGENRRAAREVVFNALWQIGTELELVA